MRLTTLSALALLTTSVACTRQAPSHEDAGYHGEPETDRNAEFDGDPVGTAGGDYIERSEAMYVIKNVRMARSNGDGTFTCFYRLQGEDRQLIDHDTHDEPRNCRFQVGDVMNVTEVTTYDRYSMDSPRGVRLQKREWVVLEKKWIKFELSEAGRASRLRRSTNRR